MSGSVSAGRFQDHYSVLGVGRKASSEEIHRAYAALAKKYHPRNGSQPDREKFDAITLAYETLSNPATRQAFDSLLPKEEEGPPLFAPGAFFEAVASEADRRMAILCILYDRRRRNPGSPGMPVRPHRGDGQLPAEPMFLRCGI